MHVNNVLPADGINGAELVVPGGKELVERIARIITASAAGNVESKKHPRREPRMFECIAAHRGDGESMGILPIEPSYLIIGFKIEIERFGIGRQPRAESIARFSARGLIESDALPVNIK